MIINNFLAALANAWEMLLDPPCPKSLSNRIQDADPDVLPELTVYGFPVLGFALGLLAVIFARIVNILPNPVASAFIFAGVCTLVSEYVTSGRSVGALSSFIELRADGMSSHDAMLHSKSDFNVNRKPAGMLSMIAILVIKAFCFFMLFQKGHTIVIAGALMLSFAGQASLAALPSMESGQPFLEAHPITFKRLWVVAFTFMIIVFISAPYAALAGMACCGAIIWIFQNMCLKNFDGMLNEKIIGIAGAVIELTALLSGFLFIR